jgi:uncharacterized protein (DUF697 family)
MKESFNKLPTQLSDQEAGPEVPHNETEKANKLVRQHVWASMGVSVIPLPILDFAGVTVIQFNMLRKLSKLYGIPLIKPSDKGKLHSFILVLLSFTDDAAVAVVRRTVLPSVSASLAASMAKFVPVAGQAVGTISSPTINGAFTYALGKVFIRHFESGGTFLSFDPEKAKDFYEEMFKEGIGVAAEMKERDA